jgi:hypothetical protein
MCAPVRSLGGKGRSTLGGTADLTMLLLNDNFTIIHTNSRSSLISDDDDSPNFLFLGITPLLPTTIPHFLNVTIYTRTPQTDSHNTDTSVIKPLNWRKPSHPWLNILILKRL